MDTHRHTLTAFDQERDELRALISQMGGHAENALREALRCLMQRDLEGAAKVVEADHRLDEMETQAESMALQLIALRAPMADDLREAVAALKITGVIERIGDYAKNIAKRVPQFDRPSDIEPIALLPEMARIAADLVRDALDAFIERDAEKAAAVCVNDKLVDDFYNSIFRALLTYMMENPHNIGPAAHLLFVAKHIERIGDHATNIAEMVYFSATGKRIGERQRGSDPAAEPIPVT
ncbi:MAG: phosphate signaling complex protein PhoU [Pseudomonadota bacterium]|nr:phosphate signaling complex protein PhoU [Pseudomonadota bacterium]